jgi:phosphoribosylformylglycinamidine synthase subunit PurS
VKARVLIRLKPGILDVQGAAVRRALAGLGFMDVVDLRVGKLIEVDVDATSAAETRSRVHEMCRKLLANPVLEDYTVEIGGAADAATDAGTAARPVDAV